MEVVCAMLFELLPSPYHMVDSACLTVYSVLFSSIVNSGILQMSCEWHCVISIIFWNQNTDASPTKTFITVYVITLTTKQNCFPWLTSDVSGNRWGSFRNVDIGQSFWDLNILGLSHSEVWVHYWPLVYQVIC